MPRFLTHVPCSASGDPSAPIQVHEISFARATHVGRCRLWHETVQPVIDRAPARPDAHWNWRRMIPALAFAGGIHRTGRIFQMTVGREMRPAAMVAVLENERWYADADRPATFLWFLSTAPAELLSLAGEDGGTLSPRLVGRAAFDIALSIALASRGQGRLWLHADPKGGSALATWYTTTIGMSVADPALYPRLPGDSLRGGRVNDGRYMFLDEHGARAAYDAMAQYRR